MTNPSPIWHPFTQHGLKAAEIFIDCAEGAYLYGRDGRRIIDAISSWWVITHGHCHPKIAAAVRAQADRLDQVIFAGFTHAPAEELAAELLRLTNYPHVFFSDSGSTAVEVALKMAIGYWAQTGKARRKILALDGGYHGDTFGAMAAGARGVFSKLYEPFLFEVEHLPFPAPGAEGETLEALEKFLKTRGDDTAAFIFEPLIQGAAGMRVYTPEILKAMTDLCRAHGIFLIADEVMTGFGRTGTLLACRQAGVEPDLMALSKGLTGGFLPMGATLASREIYNAFYHESRARMFMHSTSFTGNPLACAAAKAALELWEEEGTERKITAMTASHHKAASNFRRRGDVADVRVCGAVIAVEARDAGGYLSALAPKLYETALSRGVLLRPLGNTLYSLPPYCVTENDLEEIYDCIEFALDSVRDGGSQQAA